MALDKDMIVPEYVVLVPDGNGRWTKERGLPRTTGRKEGCATVEKTVGLAAKMGIGHLTAYGFSTENWKCSAEEVGMLIQPFRCYMVRLLKVASANNARVKMIDDRSRFDRDIIEGISRLGLETRDNTGLTLVIAMNYEGRNETRRVTAGLIRDCIPRKVESGQVDEALFVPYLDMAGMPDLDLLTRTSGEPRLSNYLLQWLAYMEIAVTDCLWPDFGREELEKATVQYNKRERRFGAVK